MNKEVIKKKLYNVNQWIQDARTAKDWKTYEEATTEYNRLLQCLKEAR